MVMTLCADRERFASAIEHRDTRASRNARPDASHDQIGGPMLLFCAPPCNRSLIAKLQYGIADLVMTRIGMCVSARSGITVLDSAGKPLSIRAEDHDHFKKY